ncbi:MAG: HipA domain-containing protein [Bacteroidales bacterium]|nr:HipA domain-containing protein [Bacteroidales bacterium]
MLTICPSTLEAGYETYSPIARKRLFKGKHISPNLPYNPVEGNEEDARLFLKNRERISLSGIQSKYSLVIRNNRLELSNAGEHGTYILKPKLNDFLNREFSPANENLTMQLAEQVYNIETAANGLCFFMNGEMAYLTRRFDIAPDGSKYRCEDFASLGGLTSENGGKKFKYDILSYEDLAELIKKRVPAWRVELLKFFDIVVFNFLISNGDAHIKNFSLLETPDGDFRLAPAYDLINTRIHLPDDPIFALRKGLFKNGEQSGSRLGISTGKTFLEFGRRIGLPDKTVNREIDRFCASYDQAESLITNSYLSEELKNQYRSMYHARRDSYLKQLV